MGIEISFKNPNLPQGVDRLLHGQHEELPRQLQSLIKYYQQGFIEEKQLNRQNQQKILALQRQIELLKLQSKQMIQIASTQIRNELEDNTLGSPTPDNNQVKSQTPGQQDKLTQQSSPIDVKPGLSPAKNESVRKQRRLEIMSSYSLKISKEERDIEALLYLQKQTEQLERQIAANIDQEIQSFKAKAFKKDGLSNRITVIDSAVQRMMDNLQRQLLQKQADYKQKINLHQRIQYQKQRYIRLLKQRASAIQQQHQIQAIGLSSVQGQVSCILESSNAQSSFSNVHNQMLLQQQQQLQIIIELDDTRIHRQSL